MTLPVKILRTAYSYEAIGVSQLRKHADLIVILKLYAYCHFNGLEVSSHMRCAGHE